MTAIRGKMIIGSSDLSADILSTDIAHLKCDTEILVHYPVHVLFTFYHNYYYIGYSVSHPCNHQICPPHKLGKSILDT